MLERLVGFTLSQRLWIDRGDRLGKDLEPIDHRDQDIVDATHLQSYANRSGSLTTVYGRIISLSSCERIWQCHT